MFGVKASDPCCQTIFIYSPFIFVFLRLHVMFFCVAVYVIRLFETVRGYSWAEHQACVLSSQYLIYFHDDSVICNLRIILFTNA